MNELEKWLEINAVPLIKERINKKADVYLYQSPNHPTVVCIEIQLHSCPLTFNIAFDRLEFVKNKKRQFKKLVKCRRRSTARDIREIGEELIKIANKLKR